MHLEGTACPILERIKKIVTEMIFRGIEFFHKTLAEKDYQMSWKDSSQT